ncbi:MAG: type II toxin-antitoxin system RelE/ParE family toxin [Rhodoferax sp.]|nr:type II toxin-antitoxin system RelE/ParE family toxin [Rhodoferax sp.]
MSAKLGRPSYTIILSGAAQQDITQILEWTQEAFGDTGRARYENLISTALIDLRADPTRTGVRQRDDIGQSICTYHLASSRKRTTTGKHVGKPRHLILFRVKKDMVEVARLLHDAMDFVQHVS